MIQKKRFSLRLRARVAAAFLLAGALAGAAPSGAQPLSPSEVRAHIHRALRHLGGVPERIERHHRRHLRFFAAGSHYYAPHRHRHEVYRLPVRVHGAVVHRAHHYCHGRLFTVVAERRRH